MSISKSIKTIYYIFIHITFPSSIINHQSSSTSTTNLLVLPYIFSYDLFIDFNGDLSNIELGFWTS